MYYPPDRTRIAIQKKHSFFQVLSSYLLIIICLYSLWITACQSSPDREHTPHSGCITMGDTFSIKIKGDRDGFLARLWQVRKIEGKEYYIRGLGPSGVDIWDLETKMKTRQIRIDKDGPIAMGEMVSFYYQNKDSLFALSQSHINLYDGQGKLVRRWWINNPERTNISGIDFNHFAFRNNQINTNAIFYHHGRIYVTIRMQNGPLANYDNPILGFLDLDSSKWVNLAIYYPDEFQHNSYGLLDWPNVVYTRDRIIVSFMIGADFWVYDYSGNLINRFSPKGGYSDLKAEPYKQSGAYDPERMMEHLNNNPSFYPVYYFKDAHTYFRVIANAKQEDPHLYFLVLMSEAGQTIHEESILTTERFQMNGRFYTSNFYYIPYVQTNENRVDLAVLDPGCGR